MTTGELDRVVTIIRETSSTDAGGGLTAVQASEWDLWAKVRDRSGSNSNSQEQSVWEYDTTVTVQHDTLKPVRSNDTLEYEGKVYKINNISISSEGRKDWAVIRCTKIGV